MTHPMIPNKHNEPPFQLEINPPEVIRFVSNEIHRKEVIVEAKIKNTSGKRQCYKVKCTSNVFFRVRDPIGFIEVGQTRIVQFCFKAKFIPNVKRHIFVVYHVSCSDEVKDVAKVWAESKAEGVRRLAIRFESENGREYECTENATK
ncbi:Major sperm protein [Aphelenchoides besseyi]|nr:Major sperm protein [Aphelenchoides besseyi]